MGYKAKTDTHMDSCLISRISGQSYTGTKKSENRHTAQINTSRSLLMSTLSLRELIKNTLSTPDNVYTPLPKKQMP